MQPLIENTANTPAFLGKLWKMVNDPGTDHVISWSPTGTSFIIQNQAQFWYELLPLYYKHNNMSSFVRQLNMYGFHKMSTVENGTMDADKDEIQFTHPYFIKDQPELLKNIKRKAAVKTAENCGKHDELSKILTDVKQLRGRQASVDNQLNAMKQENALLWREVAILRQKHLKQQKIVNKLIQFLVTLVQPSRMTVGVKRGYQLMLNESPSKKSKSSNNKTNNNPEGPTIHELDSELDLPTTIYEEETPLIDSPTTSVSSQQAELHSPMQTQLLVDNNGDVSTETGWDQPEFVSVNTEDAPDELNLNAQDELNLNAPDELNLNAPDELILSDDITEENLINTLENESSEADNGPVNEKVFLNASAPDTFLSNFIKKNYSKGKDSQEKANDSKLTSVTPTPVANNSNMALATRDKFMKSIPSTSDVYNSDLSQHVESTQSELDQFKDILNNYNSYVDANALLGLFNDEHPVYDLNVNQEREDNLVDPADPLVSGSELAPYGSTFDFTELLDDSIDGDNTAEVALPVASNDGPYSSINTPQILKEEPIFPAIQNKK